jgi:SAM-dependent methyltransferase
MKGIESWSQLSRNRKRVSKQHGKIWDVPIVKRRMERLLANIGEDTHVLEVGAGDRRYEAILKKRFPDLYYKSLDIDRNTRQDYYDLAEVQEELDFIFMFEVIEHMELLEGLRLLEQLRNRLRLGGRILLSTPNLYHPHQYFGDSTHVTFYKFEELGGLMLTAGFKNIRAFRVYNDAFFRRVFRMYVGVHLHKYLGVDFARTILMEGEHS